MIENAGIFVEYLHVGTLKIRRGWIVITLCPVLVSGIHASVDRQSCAVCGCLGASRSGGDRISWRRNPGMLPPRRQAPLHDVHGGYGGGERWFYQRSHCSWTVSLPLAAGDSGEYGAPARAPGLIGSTAAHRANCATGVSQPELATSFVHAPTRSSASPPRQQ